MVTAQKRWLTHRPRSIRLICKIITTLAGELSRREGGFGLISSHAITKLFKRLLLPHRTSKFVITCGYLNANNYKESIRIEKEEREETRRKKWLKKVFFFLYCEIVIDANLISSPNNVARSYFFELKVLNLR